jgi:DNA-binding MarR family transcriptional regulator
MNHKNESCKKIAMEAYQPYIKSSDTMELERLRTQANKPMGVAYIVGRLERAIRNRLYQALKPLDLTLGQYTALSVFYISGALSSTQLAERTMVSPQAANALIKKMEEKGLIARIPNPKHGRTININLTKEGKRLLTNCDKKVAKLEREMLKELSDKQIATLHHRLLNAVNVLKEN